MESVPHDKHGEDGKFTATYDPDEFVTAVDALDLPTTADVAERVDCPHRTALHHLNKLEDQGRLLSRKVGPAKVWRMADEQTPSEQRETGESTAQRDDGGESRDDTSDTSHDTPAGLGAVEFPDKRDRDACERAVFAARDYIRDHDGATKGEIVRGVMPDHALGYDVTAALEKLDSSNRYRGGWWRNVVTEGLEALDDVQKPDPGASTWEYIGDGADDTDDDQDSDTDALDESGPYDPTDEFK